MGVGMPDGEHPQKPGHWPGGRAQDQQGRRVPGLSLRLSTDLQQGPGSVRGRWLTPCSSTSCPPAAFLFDIHPLFCECL